MTAVERELRPRGPYSLALSARLASDAARRWADGVLVAAVPDGESASAVVALQRPDGRIAVRAPSEAALERLRFMLALDDDHSEFLRRFSRDPLLGEATRRLRGLRPLRVATVAHALLRALCGQLIEARRARAIEARIVRRAGVPVPGTVPSTGPGTGPSTVPGKGPGTVPGTGSGTVLYSPPSVDSLGALAPAELRALGLHARRAATLVRLCGSLDLERLHPLPTTTVVRRLTRERGLGPWSVGVVCLQGLGRREHGLVGDLGLVRLLGELRGRRVEPAETEELLAPYDEWAGLASVYLLAAYGAGLVPLPPGARPRRAPARFREPAGLPRSVPA